MTHFVMEIVYAARDCLFETGFILLSLALGFLAIKIGDLIADRRERKAAEAAKRRRLKNQHIEREIRIAKHAAAYRRYAAAYRRKREQNDANWARHFGNSR